jgi:hypothetical protein
MKRPSALRLVTRAPGGKPPKPPFGIGAWSATAVDVAVLLHAPHGGDRAIASVAEQVPRASTLPSGASVFVLGGAASDRRLWRLLGRRFPVTRASRCTALLVRGYVDIGAGVDEVSGDDLAWGSAPFADRL